MATWVRNNVSAVNGSANSNLTGTVDLDNDTAPGDFDPAGIESVSVSVTVAITGRADDTFDMTSAEGWEIRLGGGGTTLAASGYDAGTGTGLTSSNTASGIDLSPNNTASTAQWEGAEIDDGGTSNSWAIYVQEMKADGATLDIAAGDITVTITYTPTSTTQNITSVGTTQLAAGIDPSKLNMQIQHTLVQQLLAGVEPSVAALITAALTQQLATGLAPQANMQIQHTLVQQLLAGVDPNVAIQQFITTVLEQQLAAGIDPTLAASITAALVQQLAAGIDPALAITIQTAAAVELATGIDPALALIVSPALRQQLASGGPSDAYDGYLDATARFGTPDYANGSDFNVTEPTSRLRILLDVEVTAGLSINQTLFGWVGGTSNRKFGFGHGGATTDVRYFMSSNGTSWGYVSADVDIGFAQGTRQQIQIDHDGTTMTIYSRDPATFDKRLLVDGDWTLELQETSIDNINTISTVNAPARFATETAGTDTGASVRVYEAVVEIDNVIQAHIVGGLANLDTVNDRFTDRSGVSWGWLTDTDPTVTANAGGDTQLNLHLDFGLVQQLLSPFDPDVLGAQILTPVLVAQAAAGVDPQVNMSILTVLAQQLATGTTPVLNLHVLAALAQQLTTGTEPQVNMSIIAAVLQQFATGINPTDVTLSGGTQTITDPSATQLLAGIDPQLNLAFQTALVVQTLQGIAPQLNITIDPELEQQLAAGTEPTQLWRTIVTVLEQQLLAGVDPSVAFGITTAIAQQLATGIDPAQLDFTMFPAVAQELAAGVEPTQLSRFVVVNLVQQLAAGVDPTVVLAQAIQTALAQQLLAGIEPTQLYLQLFPAVLQQLAAGINPDSVSLTGAQQTIDPVVLQQLLAGLAPTQLDLQLIPAIAQQLAAAVDPAVAVTLAPVLAQQLATATAPDQLNLVVLSALVEQLATGIEPTQFITQIVPAILQQLVAGLDPSVAFGITPTIVQQLVAANSPQLNMAIVTALVQQLLAGLDPAINAIRIVTSGGALTVSVVDGRLAVTSVEGSASASPNTEG